MSNENLEKKTDTEGIKVDEAGNPIDPGNNPDSPKAYDDEWDRLDEKEAKVGDGDAGDDEDPAPGDAGDDSGETGDGDGEAGSSDGGSGEGEISEHHGSVQSLEKALNDTKAYSGRLQAEVDDLKKKVSDFENGKATADDVETQRKAVEDAKGTLDDVKQKVYEDYPELQALLDPLIERNEALETEVKSIKGKSEEDRRAEEEADSRKKALDHFNEKVKPVILKDHQDFDAVMKDPEYWIWAEKQRPSLRTAAAYSDDPEDISMALTEFKKFKHSDEAEELRKRDAKSREARLNNAQSLRGGASTFGKKGKADADDYDGGWDSAGKLLKKEDGG